MLLRRHSSRSYMYNHAYPFPRLLERSARVPAGSVSLGKLGNMHRLNVLLGVRSFGKLVLVDRPLARGQGDTARGRGQAADEDVLGHDTRTSLADVLGQAGRLTLLLSSNERLLTSLANELNLGLSLAAHGQQANDVGLVDDAEARVGAAAVALPVWVSGNITSRKRHGVFVAEGIVAAGGGQAERRVQRDTVGAVRVESQEATDTLPESGRLNSMLLYKVKEIIVSRCSYVVALAVLVVGLSRRPAPVRRIFVSRSVVARALGSIGLPDGGHIYLGDGYNATSGLCYRLGRHFVLIVMVRKLVEVLSGRLARRGLNWHFSGWSVDI